MKLYLFIFLSAIFLLTACNADDNTAKPTDDNGTISETVLPKGKYIVEDQTTPVITTINTGGSFNGYGSKDSAGKTAVIPNTIQEKENNLKRRYKNAMVFHADDTMKIKKAYIATLVLGRDQILGNLKAEATDGSANATDNEIKVDTTIEIGTKMKAKLMDMSGDEKKGFEIEFLGVPGSDEQKVSDKRKKATWQWRLKPLTPGKQELKLSITLIEKDGEPVNLPVKNISVVIFAEKQSFLDTVGSFFISENIKWVLTVILIPIFIAWLTSRIRYKHDNNRSSNRTKKAHQQTDNDSPAQTI
jgi:hypothetical protein